MKRPPGALPPVTLVLATRGRRDRVVDAVRSVLDGEERPAEIVVVDQNDTPLDGLPASLPDCEVRQLHRPGRGLSRANNAGADAARHPILVYTHDDVLVAPAWFGRLVRALLEGPAPVVTGRVIGGEPEVPGGFAPALNPSEVPRVYRGRVGHDVVKPMNLALRRETLRLVGGWDPRLGPGTAFHAAEDADLGFRLLESGLAIRYEPGATVTHRAWRAPGDFLPLRWRYGIGHGAFYAKHVRAAGPHVARRYLGDVKHRLRFLRQYRRGGVVRVAGQLLFLAAVPVGAVRWWLGRRGSVPPAPASGTATEDRAGGPGRGRRG